MGKDDRGFRGERMVQMTGKTGGDEEWEVSFHMMDLVRYTKYSRKGNIGGHSRGIFCEIERSDGGRVCKSCEVDNAANL
jgi:hypothetical protein